MPGNLFNYLRLSIRYFRKFVKSRLDAHAEPHSILLLIFRTLRCIMRSGHVHNHTFRHLIISIMSGYIRLFKSCSNSMWLVNHDKSILIRSIYILRGKVAWGSSKTRQRQWIYVWLCGESSLFIIVVTQMWSVKCTGETEYFGRSVDKSRIMIVIENLNEFLSSSYWMKIASQSSFD